VVEFDVVHNALLLSRRRGVILGGGIIIWREKRAELCCSRAVCHAKLLMALQTARRCVPAKQKVPRAIPRSRIVVDHDWLLNNRRLSRGERENIELQDVREPGRPSIIFLLH